MKLDTTTLLLIGAGLYFLTRGGATQPGGGVAPPAGQFPPEPPKTSPEWPRWVQIVIAIAGGLIPALFGPNGPFSGKTKGDIQAAAFGDINPYLNPSQAVFWQNQPVQWGATSPYYG